MKKVFTYFKHYKKESILAPLFKLLEASFELVVPLLVATIVDVGIAQGDKVYIIKMCLALIGLGVVGLAFSIIAQYFAAKSAVGYSTELRHALFQKMQSLSFSQIDQLGTATMITRMTSDVNQVQNGVNMVLRLFLRSPFIVLGAMIMAFVVDVPSAIVFAVVIPVLSLIIAVIMAITIPLYKKSQERLDEVLLTTRENLTGVRVIRAFCKGEEEIQVFNKKNQALTNSQKLVGRISALINPVTYAIINVGIIFLLYVGGIRVDSGTLTQGQVLALYNYMSQILIELIKLANLIITTTKSVACLERIEKVMSLENNMQQNSDTVIHSNNAVDFENVSLCYGEGGEDALQNISFSVKPGETVGIIGGTGAGKSSLVNLIPHFYDATQGRVLVNGIDVKAQDIEKLRESVGIVLQKATLFQGTIRENLQWGKNDATEEEMNSALEKAQALDVLAAKGGYDAIIEQGGRNLSGGQKQRLSIARALIKKPKILILDDSSSALDYATDAALRHALSIMEDKPTVFIVSQRTASLRYADKIIVLEEGKVVDMGTHDYLLQHSDVYREIYHSQFKEA